MSEHLRGRWSARCSLQPTGLPVRAARWPLAAAGPSCGGRDAAGRRRHSAAGQALPAPGPVARRRHRAACAPAPPVHAVDGAVRRLCPAGAAAGQAGVAHVGHDGLSGNRERKGHVLVAHAAQRGAVNRKIKRHILVPTGTNSRAQRGFWGTLAWPIAHRAAATPPLDLKTASTSGEPARFVAPHRARPAPGAAPARSPGCRAAITPPAENLRAPAPGAVPWLAIPDASRWARLPPIRGWRR